ncbi:MAG: hypothetical protein V3S55_15020 [Nitrospiraceae bacterium]
MKDATAIMVAEYQFVSRLIPMYRRVEMTAVAGAGVAVAAILGAIFALEAADKVDRVAQATLLGLAPWVFFLLVLIQITALVRINRASAYISQYLKPLADHLGERSDLLEFEQVHTRALLTSSRGWSLIVRVFVTSAPMIVAAAAPAVVAALIATILHEDGLDTAVVAAGWAGAVITFIAAGFGTYVSVVREFPQIKQSGGRKQNGGPIQAYVLIKAAVDKTKDVYNEVKGIQLAGATIVSVDVVTGDYAVIALIQAEDLDKLGVAVTDQVQKVDGLEETTTCMLVKLS